MTPRSSLLALALALAGSLAACTKNDALDFAMHAAPRPEPVTTSGQRLRVGDREVFAGDLHCHVLPPDAPYHVSRPLLPTRRLAAEEHLDFVVLTPHIPARFFQDPAERRWVVRTQRELRDALTALERGSAPDAPLVVPGFEYTDHRYGHVGGGFGDVERTLADLDASGIDLVARPEAFFERWIAHGGLLVVNHPVQIPTKGAPFMALRYDMSFRALLGLPAPPEMVFVAEHAQAFETYNASITFLRDHVVLKEGERSLRAATHLVDVAARARGPARTPIAMAGGSDSHGHWLRATTWVLANERTASAIRDGIAEGRTCVGGPDACTLQVRGDGAWKSIGDELSAGLASVEARAAGSRETTFVVDGQPVATAAPGEIVRLAVSPERCTLIRAITGASWSSHVRVGCAR